MKSFAAMTEPQVRRWHVYETTEALQQRAAQIIQQVARESIARHGVYHLVLAGGSTPRAVYERLRHIDTDWAAWQVWYGDERCLPPGDTGRNSQMAAAAWLDHVPIPAQNLHVIPAELGPTAAADTYSRSLQQLGAFDLVLLGLGEDGHTASLFPGQMPHAAAVPAALPVTDAPKPPPERVSLSAWRLSLARQVLFLVSGSGKQQAVRAWREGQDLPAAHIRPESGVDILIDFSAFA
jgi:6-phosphogluconolactonase